MGKYFKLVSLLGLNCLCTFQFQFDWRGSFSFSKVLVGSQLTSCGVQRFLKVMELQRKEVSYHPATNRDAEAHVRIIEAKFKTISSYLAKNLRQTLGFFRLGSSHFSILLSYFRSSNSLSRRLIKSRADVSLLTERSTNRLKYTP